MPLTTAIISPLYHCTYTIERQTDRQRQRLRERERKRETQKGTEREAERERETEKERETERETERHTHTPTHTETDRESCLCPPPHHHPTHTLSPFSPSPPGWLVSGYPNNVSKWEGALSGLFSC